MQIKLIVVVVVVVEQLGPGKKDGDGNSKGKVKKATGSVKASFCYRYSLGPGSALWEKEKKISERSEPRGNLRGRKGGQTTAVSLRSPI